jgi:hypothetical protein
MTTQVVIAAQAAVRPAEPITTKHNKEEGLEDGYAFTRRAHSCMA